MEQGHLDNIGMTDIVEWLVKIQGYSYDQVNANKLRHHFRGNHHLRDKE